jgi:hypothetical protein
MITYNRSGTAFPNLYNILNQPHTTFQPYVSKKKVKKQNYKPPNFYERPSDSFSDKPKKIKIVPYKGRDKEGARFADKESDDEDDITTPPAAPAAAVLPQGNNPALLPLPIPPPPPPPPSPIPKNLKKLPKSKKVLQPGYYVYDISRKNPKNMIVIDEKRQQYKFRPEFYKNLKNNLTELSPEAIKRFGLNVKGSTKDEIKRVIKLGLTSHGIINPNF